MIRTVLLALSIVTVRHPYPADRPAPVAEAIIRDVWPAHLADAAISVAFCESRMRGNARNGRFRGLFQIGPREWAAHRPRPDADIYDRRDNAQAAYSYWLTTRDWRRWSCRP